MDFKVIRLAGFQNWKIRYQIPDGFQGNHASWISELENKIPDSTRTNISLESISTLDVWAT
jgi:hypothetical protein